VASNNERPRGAGQQHEILFFDRLASFLLQHERLATAIDLSTPEA
jgi:hypothetical protein